MHLRRLLLLTLLLLGLGIGSASMALASSPLDEPIIHVVASGETLTGIASHYGTTLDELVAANQLANRDSIYIGSSLTIPAHTTTQAPQTGSKSPLTIIDEINMTGADGTGILNANTGGSDKSLDDGGTASSTAGDGEVSSYTVKSGDTLSAIANDHNLTAAALAAANGLGSQDFVYVGQVLNIPSGNGAASPASMVTGADDFFSTTYIVKAGDTINGIAARFGVTSYSIVSANSLSNASNIHVGQKLQVLGSGQVNPAPGVGAKLIEVDISKQRVFVWQGNTLVYNFVASTGQPGLDTRRGTFQIQDKLPVGMSGPLDLNMPNWLGIYWAGGTENGFHALPITRSSGNVLWGGFLGRPVSFGCIVLGNTDAKVLYNFADVGTTVKIHD